jgi:hypothetical protein
VIALMLEANADLSWRDVQWILATTSRTIESDNLDDTSITNAAGLWHSQWYGFGIVDAQTAVTAAKSWQAVEDESILAVESGFINLPLSDGPSSPVISGLTLLPKYASPQFFAESVVLYLDLTHSSRGHLQIRLSSPSGTTSILYPGRRPENSQLAESERWKLLTVQFWGEVAVGEWSLHIVDLKDGDVEQCVDDPWSFFLEERGDIQCSDLEKLDICHDNIIDPDGTLDPLAYNAIFSVPDSRGFVPAEACCGCGGGKPVSHVADQIKQWRLVVYGTSNGAAVESMLSANWDHQLIASKETSPPSGSSSKWAAFPFLQNVCGVGLCFFGGWMILICSSLEKPQ